ncbi:glucose-1-phosphate adenylyltransferase subunit GlgD [Olsenella profusa]|uniref:Glucose-1-phosphate adenylyltransferase subunit GlgD n=1 Tax=Olsenella profusa TaxID=138595 RepID=A0ABS2F4D8_9ACTN|nr:glucose-1-phosphate adenylyltransferase subunit GlgD [Olsenella profusa]MBM6775384.1 glucose-1-phosphate adenylyltransferase subunit GlgD [Olsenella profusa]
MEKVIGLITCNYSAKESSALTENRPVASLPYFGRYRLVDFALSNLVNCGIRTVGMVMPYNYRSIIDHVGSGKDWDLDRKNGGLFILPGSAFGTSRTGARFLLRDLVHNKAYFTRSTADAVICSTANFVYNVDLNQVYDAHKASGADITVLTKTAAEKDPDVTAFDVVDGRVQGVHHGTAFGDTMFLDCFVINRQLLLDMFDWYAPTDYLDLFEAMAGDFGRVNVQAYNFDGYVAPIFNKRAYYRANMDLLDPHITAELFTADRSIKTKTHDTPPAKFEVGSHVCNSAVASGDRIYGSVNDSILGRNVIVEAGATVRNSIVMQGCVVKSGARVENAIVDRGNVVPAGTELRGTPEDVLIKEKAHE